MSSGATLPLLPPFSCFFEWMSCSVSSRDAPPPLDIGLPSSSKNLCCISISSLSSAISFHIASIGSSSLRSIIPSPSRSQCSSTKKTSSSDASTAGAHVFSSGSSSAGSSTPERSLSNCSKRRSSVSLSRRYVLNFCTVRTTFSLVMTPAVDSRFFDISSLRMLSSGGQSGLRCVSSCFSSSRSSVCELSTSNLSNQPSTCALSSSSRCFFFARMASDRFWFWMRRAAPAVFCTTTIAAATYRLGYKLDICRSTSISSADQTSWLPGV